MRSSFRRPNPRTFVIELRQHHTLHAVQSASLSAAAGAVTPSCDGGRGGAAVGYQSSRLTPSSDDDTVAVYTPALPYVCAIENAVDCSMRRLERPDPCRADCAGTHAEHERTPSWLPDTFGMETGNVGQAPV